MQGDTVAVSRGPAAGLIADQTRGHKRRRLFWGQLSASARKSELLHQHGRNGCAGISAHRHAVCAGISDQPSAVYVGSLWRHDTRYALPAHPDAVTEVHGNPAIAQLGVSQPTGAMEGKEVRFGPMASAYWSIVTTDHFDRLGQLHARFVDGAVGHDGTAGYDDQRLLRRLWRRLPELLLLPDHCRLHFGFDGWPDTGILRSESRSAGNQDCVYRGVVEYVAGERRYGPGGLVLGQIPRCIATWTVKPSAWLNNPGNHGFSEILYEFTSANANNGSGFEGLGDNNFFWNYATGIVLILGRFIPIIGPVAIAGLLAQKKYVPESSGTLPTDTGTFGLMTFAVIMIITALSFFPALALGPLAEYFSLK